MLGERKTYQYLGIVEADTMKQVEMTILKMAEGRNYVRRMA